jgi:hypothetical protein
VKPTSLLVISGCKIRRNPLLQACRMPGEMERNEKFDG